MSQKLENLLNLALETPEAVRLQTDNLNVGFDSGNRSWELIVKYHGSLDGLEALGVSVEYLINSYAILTVPEQLVEAVSNIEEIEYVEKPKRYYYQDIGPAADSCMTQVTLRDPFLSGTGVLVAVLDSGIDFTRPEFRDGAGHTRILYLWDQTLRPEAGNGERQPPQGFAQGVEFSAQQIDRALAESDPQQRYMLLPSVDTSGHGTAVAGIAAGCLPAYEGSVAGIPGSQYRGAAPAASLLVVKLGLPGAEGFPRTTEIMRGVTYALQKAMELAMPLVINLSFGNTYGAHDGGSLLERFLDNAAEIGRTVICVGSGNEGNSAGHVAGNLFADGRGSGTGGAVSGTAARGIGNSVIGGAFGTVGTSAATGVAGAARPAEIQLAVAEYERSLSIQLWKNYSDMYRIYLRSPGGQETPLPESVEGGKFTLQLEQTQILVYLGKPLPYSVAQEIYLELIVPESAAGTVVGGAGMNVAGMVAGGTRTNAADTVVGGAGTNAAGTVVGGAETNAAGTVVGGAGTNAAGAVVGGAGTNAAGTVVGDAGTNAAGTVVGGAGANASGAGGRPGGGSRYINSGVWTIRIEPVRAVTGQYYLYLPSYTARSSRSGFYQPTPEVTLTIPSTAAKVITVGAYDSTYDSYADFSGRGYVDAARTVGVVSAGLVKPDLAAPGVGILAPDLYGGYAPFTGTSFATPIVSGAAALLMEWGIVRGNDVFLYGEKVKAYLRAGARPLRGEGEVPSDRVGFGAVCVEDSLTR